MREYELMQIIEEDMDKYNNYYLNQYELSYSPKSILKARNLEIQQLFIVNNKQLFKINERK